jgi:hypothetical protein
MSARSHPCSYLLLLSGGQTTIDVQGLSRYEAAPGPQKKSTGAAPLVAQ